jgi:hypothetical protein
LSERKTTAMGNKPRAWTAILIAWLTAGTLDASAASIQYYIKTKKDPSGVWRYVASGFFGKKAFAGGMIMAGWGLLFHYMIALFFTLLFFQVFPHLKFLSKSIVLTGLGYGIFAWCIMNLIVVPISNVPPFTIKLKGAIIALLILMFCIGLPISLIISWYYRKRLQAVSL